MKIVKVIHENEQNVQPIRFDNFEDLLDKFKAGERKTLKHIDNFFTNGGYKYIVPNVTKSEMESIDNAFNNPVAEDGLAVMDICYQDFEPEEAMRILKKGNSFWFRQGAVMAMTELLDLYRESTPEETISLTQAKEKYPLTNNLSIGTYALHPYASNKLVKIESYHKSLSLEKDDELVVLLGKMGAKKVVIREVGSKSSMSSGEAGFHGLSWGVEAQGNAATVTNNSRELIVEFEGNKTQIAKNLLENSLWFKDDSRVQSIFNGVVFEENPMKHYSLLLQYSESFDFDFAVAARFVSNGVDIKAEYKKVSSMERLFEVDF